MTTTKKYFWLRLKDDFFKSLAMKKLRKVAGGDTYTIIYLKLMLLSLKNEGSLFYEGVEENIADELAIILDEDPENVKVTLSFLERAGLIDYSSQTEIKMTEVPHLVGSETDKAALMRKKRAQDKNLQIEENKKDGNNVTALLPEVTNELPTVTSELPRVTEELPQVTASYQQVTEELPTVTDESNNVKKCYTEIEIEKEIDNKEIGESAAKGQHLHTLEKKLVDLYHEKCPSLPKVYKITDTRKRKIRTMFGKYSLETFGRAFDLAERSAFLKGECNNPGHESFKADFDFFLDERKLVSTLEGKYSGNGISSRGKPQIEDSGTDYEAFVAMEENLQLGRT